MRSPAPHLLPPNASPLERAAGCAINGVLDAIPTPLPSLWNPHTCPASLLPWLAWTLSADEWDSTWPESRKRELVAQSFAIHRVKGTVGSIRRVLAAAGFGEAVIVEGLDAEAYNGTITYNGTHYYGQHDSHFAMYRVYLSRPITVDQARQIRRLLANTAPVRCHLAGLHFDRALNLYDRNITYDSTYTHGVA